VERIDLPAAQFVTQGERIFQAAPVRDVRLTRVVECASVLESPLLRRLRGLELSHNQLGPAELRQLLRSKALLGLSALGLGYNNIGVTGVAALVSAPGLAELRSLDLERNFLDHQAVKALA